VRAASLAVAAAILALAACGGGSSPPHHHVHLTAFERRGKTLFIPTCGGCHQLADAGTDGVAGPALDTPWPASRVREKIADGAGLMPPGLVTGRAAAEVAAYVAAATARR
jgi:mono/diheme cytochrome c family protein